MTDTTFTFRVDDALKAEFADAARAGDRTGAQLLRDFMRSYIREQREAAAHDGWFRAQVAQGLASARAGRLVPDEEVEAEFTARRALPRG